MDEASRKRPLEEEHSSQASPLGEESRQRLVTLFGLKPNATVLLVGEGNLSFASALAALKTGAQVTATTYETEDEHRQRFQGSAERCEALRAAGMAVAHGIDATNLAATLPPEVPRPFDRIIFQFPQHPSRSKIQLHRELLGSFLKAAEGILAEAGEVVVSLLRGQGGTAAEAEQRRPKDTWQAMELGLEAGLLLRHVGSCPMKDLAELGYTTTGSEEVVRVPQERVIAIKDVKVMKFAKARVKGGSNHDFGCRDLCLSKDLSKEAIDTLAKDFPEDVGRLGSWTGSSGSRPLQKVKVEEVEERAFNSDGSLTHCFCRPGPSVQASLPIERQHDIREARWAACRFHEDQANPKDLRKAMAQSQWSVKDVCCEMRDCKALLEARQGTSPSSDFLDRIKDTIGFKLRSLPQLSAAEALELHKVLGEVDFPEAVAAALSQQIDEKLLQKTEQTTIVSLKQQSLTNMHLFLTAQDWALLEGDGADWWAKQKCIVGRLKKLGVKSLAENTVRSCVSILLSTLTVLPHPDDQHAAVLEFKGCFHSTENVDGLPYLVRFPEQPSGLPPALLQSAYTEADPPVAKSLARLAYIAKALPVRDTHNSLSANLGKSKKRPLATPQQSPVPSTALPASPSWQRGTGGSNWTASEASNPMQGFMGMCNEMVKCMQSFQAVQLQMTSRQNPSQCFQQQAEQFQPKPKELTTGATAPLQLSACNQVGQSTPMTQPELGFAAKLALPAPENKTAEPTTAEAEARNPEPEGLRELSPEEQLFESLKAKQAKAKAKCSAKAKAKGKVLKRPRAAPSALAGGPKLPKYVPEAPSAEQLSSRRACFVDKHYHKAKNIALKAGAGEDRAYEYARTARAKAAELWDSSK
ncbi:Ferredoxin-fold anticodon-binding domain-containing protein 1-like [Symbiodinium microadriaticum]|uniref:Ferredoxin-fold anticodon-binding domain-containing protein 1-like n=1 Tax=Symbiodinium microadriaticum TaxID=2951 RepID=A0A1Q9CJY5_SYMMI|nr:Ferredoxin-fold anticodon-binding domain-containing protein 1-like [Symbiodinium microadriaticum]